MSLGVYVFCFFFSFFFFVLEIGGLDVGVVMAMVERLLFLEADGEMGLAGHGEPGRGESRAFLPAQSGCRRPYQKHRGLLS